MVSLEQVKLLESKVSRTIDYVKKVTEENTGLKEKLDSYQKRIDSLEVLIQRFKEDQSLIEDGILSALDRLNQFEDALEGTLSKDSKLSSESELPVESKLSSESKLSKKSNTRSESIDSRKTKEEAPILEEEKKSDPADNGGELDIF